MSQHKTSVREWMTRNPITVAADASVTSAYGLMQHHNIRRLPVVGRDGALAGIITRSDIHQVVPFFRDESERVDAMFSLAGMTVAEIMTAGPTTVAPDDPIQRAARRMIAQHVSGLPVVEGGRVVGIITESDIFRLVVESWPDDEAGERPA